MKKCEQRKISAPVNPAKYGPQGILMPLFYMLNLNCVRVLWCTTGGEICCCCTFSESLSFLALILGSVELAWMSHGKFWSVVGF